MSANRFSCYANTTFSKQLRTQFSQSVVYTMLSIQTNSTFLCDNPFKRNKWSFAIT